MHAARLDRSDRLRRVLDVLKDRKPHSTRTIAGEANVCAVNSIVAELRANGYKIECYRVGRLWYYRLEEAP